MVVSLHKYALGALETISTAETHSPLTDAGTWREALGGAAGGTVAGSLLANVIGKEGDDAGYYAAKGAVMGGALGLTGMFTDPVLAGNMVTGAVAGGGAGALSAYLAATLLDEDKRTRDKWMRIAGAGGAMAGTMAGKNNLLNIYGKEEK